MNECHGHIILSGANFRECIDEHKDGVKKDIIRKRLEEYHTNGVTFFRDGGDNMGASAYAATVAQEYGIDYRTPIFAIHKSGCYGKFLGRGYNNLSEFKSLVLSVHHQHGDFIKIMASGILDFNEYGVVSKGAPSIEELEYIVSFCHDIGYSVMAHCSGRENVANAAAAGCDSIEHGFYIDNETLYMLKQKHIIWVPTVAPVANLIGSGKFPDHILMQIVNGHYSSINAAKKIGCIIAPGSDAGSGMVYPHNCTRQEYDYITQNTSLTVSDLDAGAQEIKRRFKL